MIRLLPNNLEKFVTDARSLFRNKWVDVCYPQIPQSRGLVTVEMVRMGTVTGAQFNLKANGEIIWAPAFPQDSDFNTSYELTRSQLVVQINTDWEKKAIFTIK